METVKPGKMLQQADSETLALEAARGDAGAFAQLLDREYSRIHRIGWRLLGDRVEAEDLAQDVCLGLARSIRGFRGESLFSTWLYRVVLNAARDRVRKASRQGALHVAFAEVDGMNRADQAARAAEAAWLRQALAALEPPLRETAVLVLDEGLAHAAAAEVLGIAEGTVAWRMSQIRRRLAAMVEAGDGAGGGER